MPTKKKTTKKVEEKDSKTSIKNIGAEFHAFDKLSPSKKYRISIITNYIMMAIGLVFMILWVLLLNSGSYDTRLVIFFIGGVVLFILGLGGMLYDLRHKPPKEEDKEDILKKLLDEGKITQEEYDELRK